ncbi:MAG: hypothetical protein IKH92_05680 [Clostridiales bacterium]|nr:hypothetical protein [Clostridiales bacterium]MBR4010848.1 hypothetical protein [Clostridiales bacterium]
MRGSKKVIRLIAIVMMVALTAGICGCSGKLPFMKGDSKTLEEYQAEATELSYYLVKRIFIADYDSVRKYIKSDERDKVEPIISKMDTRLYTEADVTIATVYTDPQTKETQIEYRITLHFQKTTNSFFCQMTLTRSGSDWRMSNAMPFCLDMERINEKFADVKREEEKNVKY